MEMRSTQKEFRVWHQLSPLRNVRFTALQLLLFTLCFIPYTSSQDLDIFPVEVALYDPDSTVPFDRPVSAVVYGQTSLYVGSSNGQILEANVRNGTSTTINSGGDNQPFSSFCRDSRGPSTLYATGRTSGAVFAFNAAGQLVRTYQLAPKGSVFLSACIQTRYQLIILDSKNDYFYYLPLSDEGEDRGEPAATDEFADNEYVGYKLPLGGDWESDKSKSINAKGIEWTQIFDQTSAFILNSGTGILYSLPVSVNGVENDKIRKVNVTGRLTTFKGAMSISFDSLDEKVMYITMPQWNAIAVLELENDAESEIKNAKFIRFMDGLSLCNGPVSISEYGNFLYVLSYKKRNPRYFTLVRIPRYRSQRGDEIFTTTYDDDPLDYTEYTSITSVNDELLKEPAKSGRNAPVPMAPATQAPIVSPSSTPEEIVMSTPTPDQTPVAAYDEQTTTTTSDEEDKPPPIFSENNSPPAEEEKSGGGSCFPYHALVTLKQGQQIPMNRLNIGDEVLVGTAQDGETQEFSKIFAFSHRDAQATSEFVKLNFESSHESNYTGPLILSPGHYVRIHEGGSSGRIELRVAEQVRINDKLIYKNGESVQVTSIEKISDRGLYNPHTMTGEIVVNNIITSTYTIDVAPVCATALLSPLRAASYINGGSSINKVISRLLRHGQQHLTRWLSSGTKHIVLH